MMAGTCDAHWPRVIALGNVLMDFSYAIEDNQDIWNELNVNADDLGECTSTELASMREAALKW